VSKYVPTSGKLDASNKANKNTTLINTNIKKDNAHPQWRKN